MKLTNKEKEDFLVKRGWTKTMGFAVPTPPANYDEHSWTFVSTKDMFEAIKKGEEPCFSCESYDYTMYDLDQAFDYEFENFCDDDKYGSYTEQDMLLKAKELCFK